MLLPARAFRLLADSTHQSLKQFLQSATFESALEESEDVGLDLDIDEPADYLKAMRLFGNTANAGDGE